MLKLIFGLTFCYIFSSCHAKMHNLTGQVGEHLKFNCKIKQGSKYSRNEFEFYRKNELMLNCDMDYWGNITFCRGLDLPWQVTVKLPSRVTISKFQLQPGDEGTYKCLTKVYSVAQSIMHGNEVDGYHPSYLPPIYYHVKIYTISRSPELFVGKLFAPRNQTLCLKDFYEFACYSDSSLNTSTNIIQGRYKYSYSEIIQRFSPENSTIQMVCCTDMNDCKSIILDPCEDRYFYFYNLTRINYRFTTGYRVLLSRVDMPGECDLADPIMNDIIAYHRDLRIMSLVFIVTYFYSAFFLLAIVMKCLSWLRRLLMTLEDRPAGTLANTFRLSEISLSTEDGVAV